MSEQQTTPIMQARPAPEGYQSWPKYWKAQGMPWRTEPEISEERQEYLWLARGAPSLTIPDHIDKQREAFLVRELEEQDNGNTRGHRLFFPFEGVKLDRADVEWLLAKHKNSNDGIVGPVDPDDEGQATRDGLNVGCADLSGSDLSGLPLAGIHGHRRTDFKAQVIVEIDRRGRIRRGRIRRKRGKDRVEPRAWTIVDHQKAQIVATLDDLRRVRLSRACLIGSDLRGAQLSGADLVGANLAFSNLQEADVSSAHFEAADLRGAILSGADLREASFNTDTSLVAVQLREQTKSNICLADVRWKGASLAAITWADVKMLGDEQEAYRQVDRDGFPKSIEETRVDFRKAVRAYRQLGIELRAQGLNDAADRFAYRAQVLQRKVLHLQGQFLSALGSQFLDLISGYGYKPMRSFITYVLVVGTFALTYFLLGNNVNPPLDPLSALVFSITSFHGRGFVPGENVLLNNPLTVIAASEAIIGLLIEITFIATFTQRFFAR